MREMRRGLKCRGMGLFNNKIEQDEKKNTQRGEKKNRQPENCSTINIHTRHKTMDQPRTADTRRLNRETKVEQLKQ